MANLELIKRLNERYGKKTPLAQKELVYPNNCEPEFERDYAPFLEAIDQNYVPYFLYSQPAEAVLMYINGFDDAALLPHLWGEGRSTYFEEYYDIIIPIIYEFGGEIDELQGAGILLVFGPPFQLKPLEELLVQAEKCAKKIMKKTKHSYVIAKIALHTSKISYHANRLLPYKEYKLLLNPLQELSTLSAESKEGQISFYQDTAIDHYFDQRTYAILEQQPDQLLECESADYVWKHYLNQQVSLRRHSYSKIRSIKLC